MQTKAVKILVCLLILSISVPTLGFSGTKKHHVSKHRQTVARKAKPPHVKSRSDTKKPIVSIVSGIQDEYRKYMNETTCLTSAIYHEARGSSLRDQYAVAEVVLNRSHDENYADSICGVLREPGQFPWYKKRMIPKKRNQEAWQLAEKIAFDVQLNKNQVLSKNVTHFHAQYVRPKWARSMKRVTKIGKHIYYSDRKSI